MSSEGQPFVTIRGATAEDGPACGQICYDAFATISEAHGFPCDLPAPDAGIGLLSMMFSAPSFYAVVAESDGKIVGSNVLLEHAVIYGVGPITIVPSYKTPEWAVSSCRLCWIERNKMGPPECGWYRLPITIDHPLFTHRSASTYANLFPACRGKRASEAFLDAWFEPANLRTRPPATSWHSVFMDSIAEPSWPMLYSRELRVVERGGRVTGYTTNLGFFGHSTAETNVDIQALLASAESFAGPGILVPSRNSSLLRWCLANGLRIVQPMTLMSIGLYNEPAGAWLPSIVF